MALKIERKFGFPFNAPKDFAHCDSRFGNPLLFYAERFNGDESEILINVDSAMRDSVKDLGELVFIAPLNSPMTAYFPAWEAYIQNNSPELHFLHSRDNLELEISSETARNHHEYFWKILKEHPLGEVLIRIYELQSSFPQMRDKTLSYVRKQLEDPSLMEQFLSQTGGQNTPLKKPYWTDEASRWSFMERFKRRLK